MKYLISRNVSNADEKKQGWSNSGRNMHCLSSYIHTQIYGTDRVKTDGFYLEDEI